MDLSDHCSETYAQTLIPRLARQKSVILFSMQLLCLRHRQRERKHPFSRSGTVTSENILENVLGGQSVRDSSLLTSTGKLRLDFGWIYENNSVFSEGRRNPPVAGMILELSWSISCFGSMIPAPYLFGDYDHNLVFSSSSQPYLTYAFGPDVTLAAIATPTTPSNKVVLHDLNFADLRCKRDRVGGLCVSIDQPLYLYQRITEPY